MSNLSQFLSGIKSVQRGTVVVAMASGVGSNTATITAVTTAKSSINLLGVTTDGAFGLPLLARVVLTNSTTVTVNASGAGAGTVNATVGYEVVEFY